MSKLVVIKIGEGSLDQGYPVTLQIGDEDATPNVSLDGYAKKWFLESLPDSGFSSPLTMMG